MKFNITTDYSIRIILYLVQCSPRVSSAQEAAKQLGLTYDYFNKVAASLRTAGFIESVKGPGGGYRLARNKSPKDISLYDIISAAQGNIRINRCLEEDGYCSRFGAARSKCPVHRVFETLQNDMIGSLMSYSIQDLCEMAESEVN